MRSLEVLNVSHKGPDLLVLVFSNRLGFRFLLSRRKIFCEFVPKICAVDQAGSTKRVLGYLNGGLTSWGRHMCQVWGMVVSSLL